MPGWGLGTETLAPEVSPQERVGGAGWSGDCLGGLETGLSSLTGLRLPGRLENKAVAEEGSNTLGAGKWNLGEEPGLRPCWGGERRRGESP